MNLLLFSIFSGDMHIIPVLLDVPAAMEDGLLFSDLLLSGCLVGVPSIDTGNFHSFHDDNMSFELFAK